MPDPRVDAYIANLDVPRRELAQALREIVRSILGLAVAVMFGAWPAAQAAPESGRCRGPEHRQFDFWIGQWEVFTPDGQKAGDNRIESIDGGCALVERWRGRGGFTGTSLNSWDAAARLWRQHWVDSQGGLLQLSGRFDGARMVLVGTRPSDSKPGALLHQRIAWTPLSDGAVRQHWEQSADDGQTWSTVFDGRYVKAK